MIRMLDFVKPNCKKWVSMFEILKGRKFKLQKKEVTFGRSKFNYVIHIVFPFES